METEAIFDALMNFSSSKGEERVFSNVQEGSPKPLKPSEKLLQDIKGYGYDISQLEAVLKTKGNQLIVSSAGSGKTTSIEFKIIYDLKSGRSTVLKNINGNSVRVPDKIWVATFLKTGADELRSSYRKWCSNLHCADMSQVMQFSTLHAEFKRALNAMGLVTDIISDSDNRRLLKKVLRVYNIKSPTRGILTEDDIGVIQSSLTRTRNMLDSNRYSSDTYEDYSLVPQLIDCILRDWKNERIIQDKVDFEDLQEILYDYCYNKEDEKVINFLSGRYNFIYIDEFQDTSQIQYALLKIYCSDAKQVIAIGDDDQTIYSWRGSDNSIITEKFMQDFKPTRNDLSVNFRCPSNILNAIKPSIECNIHRFDKTLKSHKDGGIVRVGKYYGYHQMAMTLGDLVHKDLEEGMSVAVLCRVNSDGLLPALFFDKIGKFTYSISGGGMTLDSYIGRLAIAIVKLFTESCTPDVQRVLKMLTWNSYGIDRLISICKTNHVSIWSVDREDLIYSCPEVANRILSWREFRKTAGDLAALKLVLQEYRVDVFIKDSQFNDVIRSVLISIESLLDYYNYESVDDFLMELEDINERLKARQKTKRCQVQIATVHEFKGKEADSVYVWNDSEHVFPYKRAISVEELEEERRVHYIACTRARQKNTIMYLSDKEGSFVKEMDLSNAEYLKGKTSGILNKVVTEDSEMLKGLEAFEKNAAIADSSDGVGT